MNISTENFSKSIPLTIEEIRELNRNQFALLETLRSEGREAEANLLERIAISTNRSLILRHPTFDIPQWNKTCGITHSIKVQMVQPGLLGGDQSVIVIRNYTKHKITFKSSYDQSGTFAQSPSTLIPSTGLSRDGVEIRVSSSNGKDFITGFLTGFTLGLQTAIKCEKVAASISLTVETKNYAYTVALGAIEYRNPYTNCAGIEIRGGDLKLGKDKQTAHGVDVSGHVSDVRELCREKHCGASDQFHNFYEDARSSDPTQGFTVKGHFVDLACTRFYFEFHPLGADGSVYREVTTGCK